LVTKAIGQIQRLNDGARSYFNNYQFQGISIWITLKASVNLISFGDWFLGCFQQDTLDNSRSRNRDNGADGLLLPYFRYPVFFTVDDFPVNSFRGR
jgi:hypothetical protein